MYCIVISITVTFHVVKLMIEIQNDNGRNNIKILTVQYRYKCTNSVLTQNRHKRD